METNPIPHLMGKTVLSMAGKIVNHRVTIPSNSKDLLIYTQSIQAFINV